MLLPGLQIRTHSHQETRSTGQLAHLVSCFWLLSLCKELLFISSSALVGCPESFFVTRYNGNYSWPVTSPASETEVSCRKNPLQFAQRSWWVTRHLVLIFPWKSSRFCNGKSDGGLPQHTAVPCQWIGKEIQGLSAWAAGKGRGIIPIAWRQKEPAVTAGTRLSAWAGRGNRAP